MINGLLVMPSSSDDQRYWEIENYFGDHWKKCVEKFIKDNALEIPEAANWSLEGNSQNSNWSNKKEKIIEAHKKEFGSNDTENIFETPENARTSIKNKIISVCQKSGEDEKEKREKWCKPGYV